MQDESNRVQVAIRIPQQWVYDLEAIAGRLRRPGLDINQADAIRTALAEGIQKLKTELGIQRTPATSETEAALTHGIHEGPRPKKRAPSRKTVR